MVKGLWFMDFLEFKTSKLLNFSLFSSRKWHNVPLKVPNGVLK